MSDPVLRVFCLLIASEATGSFVDGMVQAIELVAFGVPLLVIAFPVALFWRWAWRKATRPRHTD